MLGNSFSVLLLSMLLKFISLWLYRKSIFTTLRFSTVKANNLNAAVRGVLNSLLCNCRQLVFAGTFCFLLQHQSIVEFRYTLKS